MEEENKAAAQDGEEQDLPASAESQADEAKDGSESPEKGGEKPKTGKVYFYIALACTVLGAVFFGLTFTPLAVYSLCASILFCLVSLSLLGKQKKQENFKWVTALTVITYVLMGIFLAFFIGGMIWSALT